MANDLFYFCLIYPDHTLAKLTVTEKVGMCDRNKKGVLLDTWFKLIIVNPSFIWYTEIEQLIVM